MSFGDTLFKYGEVKQRGDENNVCYVKTTPVLHDNRYSFDSFFIFVSFIISYWLKMKGFTISTWILPIPICFVLTKAKRLCLSDSHVFCMLLKIARFLIYHYHLILLISVLTFVLPMLKSKLILVFLISFIILYWIAKYANIRDTTATAIKVKEDCVAANNWNE